MKQREIQNVNCCTKVFGPKIDNHLPLFRNNKVMKAFKRQEKKENRQFKFLSLSFRWITIPRESIKRMRANEMKPKISKTEKCNNNTFCVKSISREIQNTSLKCHFIILKCLKKCSFVYSSILVLIFFEYLLSRKKSRIFRFLTFLQKERLWDLFLKHCVYLYFCFDAKIRIKKVILNGFT